MGGRAVGRMVARSHRVPPVSDGYGSALAFLGQLHAGDTVVTTGTGLGSRPSGRSGAPISWRDSSRTAGSSHGLEARHRRGHGYDNLTVSPAPPTRRVQELRPVSVTRPVPDRHVVDLGQNINGWLRLGDLGPQERN